MLSRKRFAYLAVGLLCIAAVVWFAFFRVKVEQHPPFRLYAITESLWHSGNSRNVLDDVPKDYAAIDDPACINSWRLRLCWSFTLGEDPDYSLCWKSGTYNEWDNGKGYCFYSVDSIPRELRFTNVMAVVGSGTPFTEFSEGRKLHLSDLPPDSLLIMEVVDSLVPWMQAGDVQLADLEAARDRNETLGSGVSEYGRWVAFADSTVWLLSKDMPIAALLPFCTVEGAEKHDRKRELREYVVWEYVVWEYEPEKY